jgi:hypothetical protein
MESRYAEFAVAFTSGNEHQRSQLAANGKEWRNCGTRHAVHVARSLNCGGPKALTFYW